jgi:hypothetical protein
MLDDYATGKLVIGECGIPDGCCVIFKRGNDQSDELEFADKLINGKNFPGFERVMEGCKDQVACNYLLINLAKLWVYVCLVPGSQQERSQYGRLQTCSRKLLGMRTLQFLKQGGQARIRIMHFAR